MPDNRIKWKDVSITETMNTRTAPVGDLLDATMKRLDTVVDGRVQAFMEGTIEKMPDQVFFTDLRTAVVALSSLRKHF
jgi:hypothetical protein